MLNVQHAGSPIFPTIEITSEKIDVTECNKDQPLIPKNASIKKTRPRSGSWGGAYESEEEIHVRNTT